MMDFKDTELYVDANTGKMFWAKKGSVEEAERLINQILEERLKERKYEGLTIRCMLSNLADEIEKKTGKRPVFTPWSTDRNPEKISFDPVINDEGTIFIDVEWEL